MSAYTTVEVVAPTFTSVVPGRMVKLVEPEELRGTYVLTDSWACGCSLVPSAWCLQVSGHKGPCWNCTEELFIETQGAWAKLVTDS